MLTGTMVSTEEHLWAPLVDQGDRTIGAGRLHPIARALCFWLSRHLDSVPLLEWIYSTGSSLHPEFQAELSRKLWQSPGLSGGLRPIWESLASDPRIVWTPSQRYYDLSQRLSTEQSWSLSLKNRLLGALAPKLVFGQSLLRRFYPDQPLKDDRVAEFAEVELVIAWRDHGPFLIEKVRESPMKDSILSSLADDLTSLLKQAMETFAVVQQASARDDSSYIDQPSISPHVQNSGHRDWTALIELLRDSWKASLQVDRDTARSVVDRWKRFPYPVFRRLTFFAMTESDLYSPSESLAYFLEADGWWLWSPRTSREKFRLLQAICSRVSSEEILELVSTVLKGFPRSMLNDDIAEEEYRTISEHAVWLRLAKLEIWGCTLPEAAARTLTNLRYANPMWRLSEDYRDEFPLWMERRDGELPIEDEDEFLTASDKEVVSKLIAYAANEDIVLRKWRRVITKQPVRAARLIAIAADAQCWPSDLWVPVLQGMKKAELDLAQWSRFMDEMVRAPVAFYRNQTRYFAWLLRDVTSSLPSDLDAVFWMTWDRVQQFAFEADDSSETGLSKDPITRAINLPSGLLAEALLDRLANARPHVAADVSNEVWIRLTGIADGETLNHTYARVILAARLAWLYQLNLLWSESHLRKYFDWGRSLEASAIWQGFLWQAGLTPELWRSIKGDFLVAFQQKTRLGSFKKQIAILFGFVCIDRPDWLLPEEIQDTLKATDAEGREDVAWVVCQRLAGAGDKGMDMWSMLVGPWFERNWPKDYRFVEPASAFHFAMAVTYTGDAFPVAVNSVSPFLIQYEHYSPLIARLMKTTHPERFSESTLRLLDLLDTTAIWVDGNVRDLLSRLEAASAEVRNNPRFRRVDDYLRAQGV